MTAPLKNLLRAAQAVVADRASIAPEIVTESGLSAAGVELAFTRHVEVDATDEELAALVLRAGTASRVAVILSANVFVAALRAIILARAAAPEVVVRPSRRDPTFARALVDAANDSAITIDPTLDVASQDRGEIHVYGRDETIADVRAKAKIPVRGHGSGMGVAWISRDANLREAARFLADDVVVFDQRGCLSPRIAFVEGTDAHASDFADALHAALERLDTIIPRGAVPADERAAAGRYVATMTYACRALVGKNHGIGIAPAGAPLVLPPAYRHVHVAACEDAIAAQRLLAPLAKGVVIVGADEPKSAETLAPKWARVSPLGAMQRPPLDGPVDLRN